MNKKKILYSIGTLGTVIAPMATVIACGQPTSKEAIDSNIKNVKEIIKKLQTIQDLKINGSLADLGIVLKEKELIELSKWDINYGDYDQDDYYKLTAEFIVSKGTKGESDYYQEIIILKEIKLEVGDFSIEE